MNLPIIYEPNAIKLPTPQKQVKSDETGEAIIEFVDELTALQRAQLATGAMYVHPGAEGLELRVRGAILPAYSYGGDHLEWLPELEAAEQIAMANEEADPDKAGHLNTLLESPSAVETLSLAVQIDIRHRAESLARRWFVRFDDSPYGALQAFIIDTVRSRGIEAARQVFGRLCEYTSAGMGDGEAAAKVLSDIAQ